MLRPSGPVAPDRDVGDRRDVDAENAHSSPVMTAPRGRRPGRGELQAHVAGLPEEQPEVRADEREAEPRHRRSTRRGATAPARRGSRRGARRSRRAATPPTAAGEIFAAQLMLPAAMRKFTDTIAERDRRARRAVPAARSRPATRTTTGEIIAAALDEVASRSRALPSGCASTASPPLRLRSSPGTSSRYAGAMPTTPNRPNTSIKTGPVPNQWSSNAPNAPNNTGVSTISTAWPSPLPNPCQRACRSRSSTCETFPIRPAVRQAEPSSPNPLVNLFAIYGPDSRRVKPEPGFFRANAAAESPDRPAQRA